MSTRRSVSSSSGVDDGRESPFDRVALAALVLRYWWIVILIWAAVSVWVVESTRG